MGAHLRILVVDDDPCILKAFKATLELAGHSVATVGSCEDIAFCSEQGRLAITCQQTDGDWLSTESMLVAHAEDMSGANADLQPCTWWENQDGRWISLASMMVFQSDQYFSRGYCACAIAQPNRDWVIRVEYCAHPYSLFVASWEVLMNCILPTIEPHEN